MLVETRPPERKICPYCAYEFERMPTRKRRCPECQNTIMRYRDPETGAVTLMMEAQYQGFVADESRKKSEEREQRHSGARIRRWKRLLSDSFGYSSVRFDRAQERAMLPADGVWRSFNELVSELSDNHEFESLYYQMALFLSEERKGKDEDVIRLLREANRFRLLELKALGVVTRVSIHSDKGCAGCTAMEGAVYTIEEALSQAPVPNPNCTHKFNESGAHFCRCMYAARL
jgi:hypothetical protein